MRSYTENTPNYLFTLFSDVGAFARFPPWVTWQLARQSAPVALHEEPLSALHI